MASAVFNLPQVLVNVPVLTSFVRMTGFVWTLANTLFANIGNGYVSTGNATIRYPTVASLGDAFSVVNVGSEPLLLRQNLGGNTFSSLGALPTGSRGYLQVESGGNALIMCTEDNTNNCDNWYASGSGFSLGGQVNFNPNNWYTYPSGDAECTTGNSFTIDCASAGTYGSAEVLVANAVDTSSVVGTVYTEYTLTNMQLSDGNAFFALQLVDLNGNSITLRAYPATGELYGFSTSVGYYLLTSGVNMTTPYTIAVWYDNTQIPTLWYFADSQGNSGQGGYENSFYASSPLILRVGIQPPNGGSMRVLVNVGQELFELQHALGKVDWSGVEIVQDMIA